MLNPANNQWCLTAKIKKSWLVELAPALLLVISSNTIFSYQQKILSAL